ncbi:prepilin-type N-terminal cleavage/methylation domain-containing protein [Patescibacteria group bacterium]|nr:prepilin-type N-terminal cleavage/methylation domain-containing protein [Patescibacteria group bacterium]
MKKSCDKEGFTLVEILAVLFIIVLLSGIIFANYRTGGQRFALQRSANKLAQDIRRAQQMAMSAKECEECGGIVPQSGYGIYLEVASPYIYKLYADTDPNEFFTPGDTIVGPPYIELEKGVLIHDIDTPPQKVSINFKPPDPSVKIKPDIGSDLDKVTITLALEADPSNTKTIKVNKAGLIEIE